MKSRLVTMAVSATLLLSASHTFAQPRQSVQFENPFGKSHVLQPVKSVFDISTNLLHRSHKVTVQNLNRYVRLRDRTSGAVIQVQWSGLNAKASNSFEAVAEYLTDLPANTTRTLELAGPLKEPPTAVAPIKVTEDKRAKTVEVRTGRLAVRLPGPGSNLPPVLSICRLPAMAGEPTSEVKSSELAWRGSGKFVNTPALEKCTVERGQVGPVYYRQMMTYQFAGGLTYQCTATFWSGQDYLTVEEKTNGPGKREIRWEFDLADWPTHVYTASNWATHSLGGYRHSGAYDEFALAGRKSGEDVVRLPNYLIWTVREEALLACMVRQSVTVSGERFEPDMLMICSVRRGDWEDKLFEQTAKTPLSDHPDQPWSQRRWWGSPETAIRVVRNYKPDAGASIRFSLVPGTRQWAFWVGDSSTLPKPMERLESPPLPSLVKTAVGEVRLTELQDYILDFPSDPKVEHPRIEMTGAMVSQIEEKAKSDPFFAANLPVVEQNRALTALRTGDKALAAEIAGGILGDLHSRINYPLTDGIEFSSHFSPVGVRPVFQHACQTDSLLGAELLDEATQRRLKAAFAFLAYRLCDSSFMAWKYNAGHPNFDADRYAAIAAIAMLYPEHPDSQKWMSHAVSCMREAMRVYVIPDSGKWAENLGNYYSWSAAIEGTLASALKRTGSADPYEWPEFRSFWKWALLTVLPPKPEVGKLAGDGATLRRVRQMAAVGDVSNDGGHPLHGAFALAGADMMEHDPDLGTQFLWMWSQGGRAGVDQSPVGMFFGLDRDNIQVADEPASAARLASRRLSGYGSIFRANFAEPTESYLLFKCGPGGYRYHGEEGSFSLFGLGQPLTLDTGASGSADQHSTIILGDKPLERGRVVQFESTPELDYVCGRFADSETHKDVLTRQILFRKNDYLVVRDEMDSKMASHWYLLLLAREMTPSRGQVLAKGWLGVDVKVSLFGAVQGSSNLTAVEASDIHIEPAAYQQQRIDVSAPPGVSLVAVLDFYKSAERPHEVSVKGDSVLITGDSLAGDVVRMSGKAVPWAEVVLTDAGQAATWHSSGLSDPWPAQIR